MQAMQAMNSSQSCLLSSHSHEFPCSSTMSMWRAAQQKGNETGGQSYQPCQLNVHQKCSKPHNKHFCWRTTHKHGVQSYTPLWHMTKQVVRPTGSLFTRVNLGFFGMPTHNFQLYGLGYLRISQPFAFVSSEKSDL